MMRPVETGIRLCIRAAAISLLGPCIASATDAADAAHRSILISTTGWAYAAVAAVLVLLVGVVLILLPKRGAASGIIAAPSSIQPRLPLKDDDRAVQRARKGELAATSGMLGELLEDYLRSRFLHLLLVYENGASLRQRLGQVEGAYAAVSFFYFCKLISLLAECESEVGAMPLLSSPAAHDAAQRLMNSFLSSIPQGEGEGSIDVFEIERSFTNIFRVKISTGGSRSERSTLQVGDFVRRVDPKRYVGEGQSEGEVEKLLAKDFDAYEKWLLLAPPGLIVAAEALKAFHELISQDLRGVTDLRQAISSSMPTETPDWLALQALSGKLTPLGLDSVLSQSRLPRPIGVFLRKGPLQETGGLTQLPRPTEKPSAEPKDTEPPMQSTGLPADAKKSTVLTVDVELLERLNKVMGKELVQQQQIGTQYVYGPGRS